MKHFREIKKRLPVLLLIGILILCSGFILINCGKGPQAKITNPDAGQFAIDFSLRPDPGVAQVVVVSSELPSLAGKGFTVEAWVKVKGTSTSGSIFDRSDNSGGTRLWVNDNEPKFAIRLPNPSGTGTPVDYTVESNSALGVDVWHHIAGVLVNAVHTHPSSTFGAACATAAAETPHIDIYVDGELKNCASTDSQFLPAFSCPAEALAGGTCAFNAFTIGIFMGGDASDGTTAPATIDGVVDEVRFWTVSRTANQINNCRLTELGLTDGECGRLNPNLANLGGYLRFNEGKGSSVGDFSGMGSGAKENPSAQAWDGGWVSGAPITRKD